MLLEITTPTKKRAQEEMKCHFIKVDFVNVAL